MVIKWEKTSRDTACKQTKHQHEMVGDALQIRKSKHTETAHELGGQEHHGPANVGSTSNTRVSTGGTMPEAASAD